MTKLYFSGNTNIKTEISGVPYLSNISNMDDNIINTDNFKLPLIITSSIVYKNTLYICGFYSHMLKGDFKDLNTHGYFAKADEPNNNIITKGPPTGIYNMSIYNGYLFLSGYQDEPDQTPYTTYLAIYDGINYKERTLPNMELDDKAACIYDTIVYKGYLYMCGYNNDGDTLYIARHRYDEMDSITRINPSSPTPVKGGFTCMAEYKNTLYIAGYEGDYLNTFIIPWTYQPGTRKRYLVTIKDTVLSSTNIFSENDTGMVLDMEVFKGHLYIISYVDKENGKSMILTKYDGKNMTTIDTDKECESSFIGNCITEYENNLYIGGCTNHPDPQGYIAKYDGKVIGNNLIKTNPKDTFTIIRHINGVNTKSKFLIMLLVYIIGGVILLIIIISTIRYYIRRNK